jgi:hypothetical protein
MLLARGRGMHAGDVSLPERIRAPGSSSSSHPSLDGCRPGNAAPTASHGRPPFCASEAAEGPEGWGPAVGDALAHAFVRIMHKATHPEIEAVKRTAEMVMREMAAGEVLQWGGVAGAPAAKRAGQSLSGLYGIAA